MQKNSTTTTSKQSKSKTTAKPRFRITERDIQMMEANYKYRILDSKQHQRLFFAHTTTGVQCRLRLRLLAESGFLHSKEQMTLLSEGNKPRIYFLDTKGAHFLANQYDVEVEELDWRPNEWNVGQNFVEHTLKTNDIRISFEQAAEKHGFIVQNWLDDRALKRHQAEDSIEITDSKGRKQKAAAIADGHFEVLTNKRGYHFSLETDLRTITAKSSEGAKNERDWSRRIKVILEYYHSGKYEKRYNTTSMRWLTVTTGEKRLEHLKHVTEQNSGRVRFWFATFDRIQQADVDILYSPIWNVAGREGLYPLIDQ